MPTIRVTSPILDPNTGKPIVREVLTEELSGPTVTSSWETDSRRVPITDR